MSSIKEIIQKWGDVIISPEQAKEIRKIEKNPIYHAVECEKSNMPPYGDEHYDFTDIIYWLDFESRYQDEEEDDGMYSRQAINSIQRWIERNDPDGKHRAY